MCDDHSEHLAEMRRLLADLDAQHRREQQAFAEGFKSGFLDGFDVGHGRAHQEMADEWHTVAEKVRALGKGR